MNESEGYPLLDANDAAILMHRDAHFGGEFSIMLDYYLQDKKGAQPDFTIERIEELALIEKQLNQNLAAVLLSGPEAEKVAQARDAYKKLRDLYENPQIKNRYPILIADLILSEEREPEKEIEAIVNEKEKIVPALIELLKAENFYDTLFPGYGEAPFLAAKCLGLIGDKRAIIAIFEALGSEDFFSDEIALAALKAIGEPAKEFLLKVLNGRPLNADNEKAALGLLGFKDDPQVAQLSLKMLQDPKVQQNWSLATYLILICEGLVNRDDREAFIQLKDQPEFPKNLKQDIQVVAKNWN